MLLPLLVLAQVMHPCPEDMGAVVHAGDKGVVLPKVLRKIEPEFTPEARRAKITSSILMLNLVVPPLGAACNIEVMSPIGFGLDEAAVAAVRKWEFRPATAAGKKTAIAATIEVRFAYEGDPPGPDEERRAEFNQAVFALRKETSETALKTLEKLSAKKYSPADAYLAFLLSTGKYVAANPARAFQLATRADKKNDSLAMYVLGLLYFEGVGAPLDVAKGRKLMQEAAVAGRPEAQLWLGDQLTLEGKTDEARKRYKLCEQQLEVCKTKAAP